MQFIGTYDGVEGDSASITITTAIISALENIPIHQNIAMTGSLNVRGMVLPIGGATAKLEAAGDAGITRVLIPKENANDVMIESRYYKNMEIILVETFRDVIEYAFADCPRKQEYMDKLLPLQRNGASTAVKVIPPVIHEEHVIVDEAEEVVQTTSCDSPTVTVDVKEDVTPSPQ